jgi:hypothetical protein
MSYPVGLWQHAVEVDALLRGVVVRIRPHGEARALEQRPVVLPARIADEHRRPGADALQEVRTDLEATGAAERLDRGDTPLGDDGALGAEHQALHGLVIGRDAVDRQVAARLRRRQDGALRLLHALQQRQLAVVVVVDAHAEIDLPRLRVGGELFIESKNRVAGSLFNGGKKRRHGQSLAKVGGISSVV